MAKSQPPEDVRHDPDFLTGNPRPPEPDPEPEPGPPPAWDDGAQPGDVRLDDDGHASGFDPGLPVGNQLADGTALYRRYADGRVYAGATEQEWTEEHDQLLEALNRPDR